MKKIGVVAFAVLMTLLLAGCGNKKQMLVCTQNASGVDVTFNVGFKGNMIETMDFKYDMDLAQYSDAQIEAIGKQDFCTTIKASMSEYKDAFEKCEHNVADKHLNVVAELDVNKIAKNTLDKMGSINSGKEALEAQGYTCTIK